jgi:peptidyl-prolyl cis-trans isomerase SurA
MTLFGNKKKKLILIIALLAVIIFENANSIENKIELKINNKIITSYDIIDEANYLKAFNKNFKDFDDQKIREISKNSLTSQTIKELEILNYVKNIDTNNELTDRIIQQNFRKMGIQNYNEFLRYLETYNVDINIIKKKITLDILWKQLILKKYSNKIKIDEEKLKNKISKNTNSKIKSYLLMEILFLAESKKEFEKKNKNIKESISKIGFGNTALTYSVSDSSKDSGRIGWVSENSLNEKIKMNLDKLNIGEITEPIIMPGSFLILKIEDIKLENKNLNQDLEIKRLIDNEKNKQLKQFSNIYFNKIKKDYQINEL